MQTANAPPAGVPSQLPTAGTPFLSSDEGQLALTILAFGALIVVAELIMLRSKQATAEDATRAFAVTLIIIGTLVLICAGYSNNQIAPAMGLFGTIAGYLLGRRSSQ